MRLIALKILMGDRAKYIGILIGITFASLLITQQSAIFTGLMTRTYGLLSDTGAPDLWVMDPEVRRVTDTKPMQNSELYRVRGVEGVDWAVNYYKNLLSAQLPGGQSEGIWLIGLDDATLFGGPATMVEGSLSDLRRRDAVIMDVTEGNQRMFKSPPGEVKIPLEVGDVIEINDHRAEIVGLAEMTRTFESQPMIFTTYSRALEFAPPERKQLTFILVKIKEGEDRKVVAERIKKQTGLQALTRNEFSQLTYDYYFNETGIPINFGIAVLLGFFVGTVIAGQTFYNFTLDNLPHFATFKAMGASNFLITRMILLQALTAGGIGYGLGIGGACLFGLLIENSELSFRLEWSLLFFTAGAVLLISVLSALLSIHRVVRLEPAMVFRA